MLKPALLILVLGLEWAHPMCFLKEIATEKRQAIDRPRVLDEYHCKILCAEDAKCLAYTFTSEACILLGRQISITMDAVCPEYEWIKTTNDKNCPDIFKQPRIDSEYIPSPALSKGATQVGIDEGFLFNGGTACPEGAIMRIIRPNNSHTVQGEESSVMWDGKLGSWIFVKRMLSKGTSKRNITTYIRAARCFNIDPGMFTGQKRGCKKNHECYM